MSKISKRLLSIEEYGHLLKNQGLEDKEIRGIVNSMKNKGVWR